MSLDYEAINAAAWASMEALAHDIDPGAMREGSEWCMNAHWRGERRRNSLKANVQKRIIKDFAGDGYDPIKLWAAHRGISNGDAAVELAQRFGVGEGEERTKWKGPKPSSAYVPMHAVQEELPYQPPPGNPTGIWTYLDPQGRHLFQRPRYDSPDGSKAVTWWSVCRKPDGSLEWSKTAPPVPRPLYGLDRLQTLENGMVLVVEGEKTADAAKALFPHMAVVTSGASDSASTTDWTPLRGRDVVLWPDHDEPGTKYAGAVHAQIKALGMCLRVVSVPDHFPPKWDLADSSPVGPDELKRMIDQARPWTGEEIEERPHVLDVLRWSDLKDSPVPEVRWLWEPYFPFVPFGILASHPGHGKSLLSLQIAVGTATGLPVFGLPTCGPAGAGVLALEDDQNVIHRRLKAIREEYGSTWTAAHDDLLDSNLRVIVRARTPMEGLEGTVAAHHLAALARELGAAMGDTKDPPAVLFLDTLNAVYGGDENSNTEVRALTATIFGLHDALRCSVWALHHLRKSGGAKSGPTFPERMDPELVRGAGALVGSARAVVQLGWIQPNEAGKANLETLNSQRVYAILGLTKVNDGPLSHWLLLEHSRHAGLWEPTLGGDEALSALRGGNAVEKLNKAEALLLDVSKGINRKALAEKHYPGDPKADMRLKGMLQDLRRHYGWLQKGSTELTDQGRERVRELGRKEVGDTSQEEPGNDPLCESA